MSKKWLALGCIFAALAVIVGAFGAHGLQKYVESGEMDAKSIQNWETAARYQMYHAFALILCGIFGKLFGEQRTLNVSAVLFTTGIVFFSGSLYLLSTRQVIGLENYKWLGPITPLGGLCFISAWILLAWTALKKQAPNS